MVVFLIIKKKHRCIVSSHPHPQQAKNTLLSPNAPSSILDCRQMVLAVLYKPRLLEILVELIRYLSRYFSALRNVSKKMCCRRHFLRSRSVMRCFCSGLTRSSIRQSKSRNGKGSTPNVRKRVSYKSKTVIQASILLATCSA